MVTTLEPAVSPKLAKGYQRMKICDVSWDTYEKIGEAFLNRANIRLTYDRGNLEIITLSPEHERLKWLFGLLVSCIAEELNIRIGGFASTTYKQEEA